MSSTALVVGASSKIGEVIVNYLADKGFKLILHYNKGFERIKRVIESSNVRKQLLAIVRADLVRDSITEFINRVVSYGDIDVAILLSAMYDETPIDMLSEGRIKEVLELNLVSHVVLTILLGRVMRKRGKGLIVIFSDLVSLRTSNPYLGLKPSIPYIVSKAGLNTLIRFIARELAPIRIVGIAPGWIDLPTLNKRLKEMIKSTVPAGRPAKIEEVIHVLELVIRNEYINGTVIEVSGGI